MKKFIYKKKNWIEDEQGAVVVEATISLTAFMFAIVTILTIVNICLAQARIGIAICGAASDISKFSYLYELTGIQSARNSMAADAADAEKIVNTLDSAIGKVKTMDLSGAAGEFQSAGESVSGMAENGELLQNVIILVKHEAVEYGTDAAMKALCDALVVSHMKNGNMSGNEYLKFLGVVGADANNSGLDFSGSKFCTPNSGGSDDIIVVVSYDIHVIKLLGLDINFHFQQCAPTKAWKAAAE